MRLGAGPRLKRDLAIMTALSVVYVGVASLVSNSYYQLILTLVPIWAVFAVSWNILSGYGGQLSFGHASFFGIGAFTVTLCFVSLGISPWLGIPIAMVMGGVAAVVIGIPTFRLRGHYFALSMLAYPLAILYFLQFAGLQEVALPMMRDNPVAFMQFKNPFWYTALATLLLLAGVAVSLVIENSRFGLALFAIRQNELAAEAAGLNARAWKMRSLVVSGVMAAAAGGLYAPVLLVVTPDSVFGMIVSAQPVVMSLFGGVASVWGPVIGAAILVPLSETLQAELGSVLPGIQGVVYGLAIILIMLSTPDGLFWSLRDRFIRRKAPDPIPDVPAEAPHVYAQTRDGGPLLTVTGVNKSFGGLRAVSDVGFTVQTGEILGIIGPNGAGKTTLFNVLNGVLPADSGSALLDGQQMIGRKSFEVCHMGVGRTFQVVRSFPRLSLLDNVTVGAYGAGLPDDAAIASSVHALRRVGLADIAGVEARHLTNKQLRLMELARALAGQPRILLLDETLAGLGREECDDVLDVLARLRDEGMTICIIEHTMHAMMRIADRFVVLDHGAVLATGLPRDVVEDHAVIEAYLGKKWLARREEAA
jgi:branched-chain amino acid transport system permease protein